MRQLLAVVAALGVAAAAAVILGEYELRGWVPLLAGAVVGALIAEVVAAVAKTSDVALTGAAALVAEGAMVWAVWISTGRGVVPAAGTAWLGVVLAAVVAAAWFTSASQRGQRSPDGS